MEFKQPKAKKNSPTVKNFVLPLPPNNTKIVGVFNGSYVTVADWESMHCLYDEGYFGKGSLSKSAPVYHCKKNDIPRVVLEQQFENQTKWKSEIHYSSTEKYTGCKKNSSYKLSEKSVSEFFQSAFALDLSELWKTWKKKQNIISINIQPKKISENSSCSKLLEFSSDTDEYIDAVFCEFVNEILNSKKEKTWVPLAKTEEELIVVESSFNIDEADLQMSSLKPRLEKLPYYAEENVVLSLEETLFLNFAAGCLKIIDLNQTELSSSDLWKKFNEIDKNYLEKYVAYHYYRSKGWVVKSGLKFGGDFLLYKDGPDFYHSDCLVKVFDKRKKNLTWKEFIATNRLAETFNKDLIFVEVIQNSEELDDSFPNCLKNYSIQEMMCRRWFPSKERCYKEETSSS